MSKRTAALAVVLALVIGAAIGFAWHAPGHSSTWTDIRTWVGFAIVIIGATIALTQLDMQRRQLASQQAVLQGEVERNKRRDALLDGQLRELEQRARTLDRQQAEAIDLIASSTFRVFPGLDPSPPVGGSHSAEVANGSQRPIRNVAARLEPAPGNDLLEARLSGLYSEVSAAGARAPGMTGPSRALVETAETSRIPLMPAEGRGAFLFTVGVRRYPEARMTVRFTDDAGLHWQIDHNLHLEKLDNRDW